MFNALVVAVVQLVASYFLAPFTILGATRAAEAMSIGTNPLVKALILASGLGLVVWLIGLVVSVMLGARIPLLGALVMSLLLAIAPFLLMQYVPATKDTIMALAGRATAVTRIPLDIFHVCSLTGFVGYWLAMLFRRG